MKSVSNGRWRYLLLFKSMGFSGRSETVRAAIKHFVAEEQGAGIMKGRIHAVMLVTHPARADEAVTGIIHRFDDIIVTHLHNKAETEKCLETFIVSGNAARVRAMFKALQSNRKADYVRLLVI